MMKTAVQCALLVTAMFVSPGSLHSQWVQTHGSTSGPVPCFAVSGQDLFAGTANGVFRSTDGGASWTDASTGLTHRVIFGLAAMDSNLFAGTVGGGVFLSTNKGSSWTSSNTGLTDLVVRTFAIRETLLFAGTDGAGVFRSSNSGSTWVAVDTGMTNLQVYVLTVTGADILAGTAGGVFLSTDQGSHWTSASVGIGNRAVYALATNSGTLFAGTYDTGVFRSTDNGASWSVAGSGMEGHPTVVDIVGTGSVLFAGTFSDGVFRSTNNGMQWTAVNAGLSSLRIVALGLSITHLFAGTSDAGVWRRPLAEVTVPVEGVSPKSPTQLSLAQNYPNPFNPSTTLSFALPEPSTVSLVVYDVLGRKIAELAAGPYAAGYHTATWNASDQASGIYFARFTATSAEGEPVYNKVNKLVLMK